MSYYRNPTENAAIGAVDREIRYMTRRAAKIRSAYRAGRLTQQELVQAKREFTGIYSRLLREALSD